MCTTRAADLDEARAFFKKLVSLDLVTEVEEENQQVEGEPGLNHMPSLLHRDVQMPGGLQRHQSLMGPNDPEQEFLQKQFQLKEQFKSNLHNMMSQNLELKYLTPV
jgi:hypothetical protein